MILGIGMDKWTHFFGSYMVARFTFDAFTILGHPKSKTVTLFLAILASVICGLWKEYTDPWIDYWDLFANGLGVCLFCIPIIVDIFMVNDGE